jgi:hypothetical protein
MSNPNSFITPQTWSPRMDGGLVLSNSNLPTYTIGSFVPVYIDVTTGQLVCGSPTTSFTGGGGTAAPSFDSSQISFDSTQYSMDAQSGGGTPANFTNWNGETLGALVVDPTNLPALTVGTPMPLMMDVNTGKLLAG